MTKLFITSSGTGIGKTFLTAAIARYCREQEGSIRAVKPMITDYTTETFAESDTALLLGGMGVEATPAEIDRCSPWRFIAPLSPDMAAAREGQTIDFAAVVKWCSEVLAGPEETILAEGVGGVMVPIDAKHTVLDWIAALNIPAVLVVGSYLGTISHTLTAFRALTVPVKAIIVNESEVSPVPITETAETIARFVTAPVLTLPHNPSKADLASVIKPLLR